MKKFSTILIFGALLLSASCAKDATMGGGDVSETSVVTFTVQQPGSVQTKSYSDGLTATTLSYALYSLDDDGNIAEYFDALSSETLGQETFSDLKATVSFNLIKGNSYGIVFWAQSSTDVYDVEFDPDSDGPTVTMSSSLTCNKEEYDAFYAYVEIIDVNGSLSETVELYRPFAQLNFGTDDFKALHAQGVDTTAITTEVVVDGVYSAFSLLDGSVIGDAGEVTYSAATVPTEDDGTFPVDGYTYVSMNYLLVGPDKVTVDATLTSTETALDNSVLEVPSVPVQANYRTNIYGSLYTSTYDYTVEIVPSYTDDYCYYATSASELTSLLSSEGYAILGADISTSSALSLSGEIDMNGYSISAAYLYVAEGESLTITGDEDENSSITTTATAVIYSPGSSTSITVENVTLQSTYSGSSQCRIVRIGTDGTTSGNTVTLTNCVIDGSDNTYSTCVYVAGTDNTVIVDGCTITATYMGLTFNGTSDAGNSTMTLTNSTITAKYSGVYISSYAAAVKDVLTVEGCTITSTEESAIEVKKTDLTVSNSTLIALNEDKGESQYYALKGNGSNGYGYGITLAGYTSGTAYEGEVSLSDITYQISATYALDGQSDPWNVCYYNGSEGVDYTTIDGSPSDGSSTE